MANGRIGWAEVGPVFKGRIGWAEVGSIFKGRISWAEVGVPLVAAKGRVGWAEVGPATASAKGRIGWAELAPQITPASFSLVCLPGYFQSQGADALADHAMDLGVGSFSSTAEEVNLVLGDDVFKLSATPIGKRLSLSIRPPNLSTRIR